MLLPERKGEIYIELRRAGSEYNERTDLSRIARNKEDKLTLIVRDNGRGFPEELDFRNTISLGLQLVTTLVDQIEGDIELDSSIGTAFKISFFRR